MEKLKTAFEKLMKPLMITRHRSWALFLAIFLLPAYGFGVEEQEEDNFLRSIGLTGYYSFPFHQGGAEMQFTTGEDIYRSLEIGFRYQQLNSYDRTNREYKLGYSIGWPIYSFELYGVPQEVTTGLGINVKVLEDVPDPEPLFDDKVSRWGAALHGRTSLQAALSDHWHGALSIYYEGALVSNYQKGYAPFDAPSRPFFTGTIMPGIGVFYKW